MINNAAAGVKRRTENAPRRDIIVTTPEQQQAQDPLSAKGAARRRFTRAGLGASGVLLTLASQPGMAQTICTTPSGSLSGGLQSRAPQTVVCQGLSPGYWKGHNDWPAGYTRDTLNTQGIVSGTGTLFTDGARGFPVSSLKKKSASGGSTVPTSYDSPYCTFDRILDHQDFDDQNFGMHLAATMLNIKSGRISFLTADQLVNMWNEVRTRGWFEPTANVKWYPYDIVNYLKGTMS